MTPQESELLDQLFDRSDLAREAGINDIDKNAGGLQSPPADAPDDAFGPPDDQSGFDNADFSGDDGSGGGDSYDV